jgi:hypothetical protein
VDVKLSDAERNLILVAVWQMKHSRGKLYAERTDLSFDSVG